LFAAASFRLLPSVNRILGSAQSLRYGLPVIGSLYAELGVLASAQAPSDRNRMPFRESLELHQVTYVYPGKVDPALREISLRIRKGESVGFIGASGAGKSTLVDILLGLLSPNAGQVRVDSQDIKDHLRNWQDQIGYVAQSIFLTDDTLRRNIALGLPDKQIDEEALWRAVCAAQLAEFVNSLPEGLDTVVGERGVRLSGGQRQRIGIARALLHDPALLVLDEATSSLDTATEGEVMEAVRALHGTKTIIIVAHRLSTVQQCDRLYRLDQGRIVQEGAPRHVLAATRST
jgi:ABC-type multidrug transport system fused ATPase/permease subunit